MSEEKFKGEADIEKIALKNVPSYLDVYQLNFEGNLLIVQGTTHRAGNTKEVVWVYKRIRG